jgi:hypothetical protein
MAFSFRRFRERALSRPQSAELWRSTPSLVMPRESGIPPALPDLDSPLAPNDKDAGRTISYDRVVLRGGRFAHECLSLTGDLTS